MKKYIKWILEMRYVYLFILQIALVFLLNKIDIKLENSIKVYGLILQLLGSIIIVYILTDRVILFTGSGLGKFFTDYFSRFPGRRIKRNIKLMTGSANITISTSAPHISISPKEDLKDIIRYFDEEIKNLHYRVTKTKEEIEKQINVINNDIEKLKNNIGDEIKATKKLISDSSVSNIWLDLYGVMTAIIGLIFATLPDLIVKLI